MSTTAIRCQSLVLSKSSAKFANSCVLTEHVGLEHSSHTFTLCNVDPTGSRLYTDPWIFGKFPDFPGVGGGGGGGYSLSVKMAEN